MRLCSDGCEIVFGRWGLNVEVRYKGKVIMTDQKSEINGLWYVPTTKISKDNPEQSNDSGDNPEKEVQETATQAT